MEHAYKGEEGAVRSLQKEEAAFIKRTRRLSILIGLISSFPVGLVMAAVVGGYAMSAKSLFLTVIVPAVLVYWIGVIQLNNVTAEDPNAFKHPRYLHLYRKCMLVLAILGVGGVVGLATMLQNLPALACAR